MMKRILLAVGVLCVGGLVISVQRAPDGAGVIQPLVELSPAKLAKLQRKARALASRRFDNPDVAAQYYVNSRTGPIITRGPNPTVGSRTLSPSMYFPGIGQMRGMPRYSAGTGMRLSASAAAGDVLGTWTSLGPANQGGRTRALLIDPNDPNLMYAGGVDGGVWKSTDAGANWTAPGDLMANIAVVTLAFDPQNSSVIYAGTGEGFFNFDAIRGAGIFRSTDAGASWNQLASTNTSNFYYTMKVLVSPRNSQRLWAATRAGVFRSLDAGATWSMVLSGSAVNGCTDMAMQVTGAAGYVFASCGTFVQGTVYRADDDDASVFASVLSLAGQGRSSIAVAPSDESVVYVLAAQSTSGAGPGLDGLHGVYRSSANGDPGSFTTQRQGNVTPGNDAQKLNQLLLSNPVYAFAACVGSGVDGYYNQGWYDNVIAVDPTDANRVWAGGVDLWRSDNGGVDWGTGGYWWFGKGADPQYHHADQHGIVFHPQYNGTSNKVMFSASDGGVERIDDARAPVNTTVDQLCGAPVAGGPTWVDRNNGYVTTQFYDGAVYPDGQSYFGGLQDNGTQRGSSASPNWTMLLGGDGGYTAVDTRGDASPGNDVLFAEFTGLSLQKSTNGGGSFFDAISGIVGDPGFLFIAPFTMNDVFKQHLWAGGWYVWRTTNQAASWSRASAITCGNGSISAVAAHPLDGNRVLVGMSDGCYQYNHAALSGTAATVWVAGTFGTSFISQMAWDPTDVNVAYATISRFGGTNLFKSTNGGATWAPSVGTGLTALPQIPARSVVVHPTDSQQVFVGTDLGVFTSVDAGANWYVENTGFANVSVNALKFDATATPTLYAFTHGRGAWKVGASAVKVATATVVTFEAGPYVYRGSAFTATAIVTGGTLNQAVAVVYSGDCTNVTVPNGCTATATFAETVDYLGSTDAKSITITTAPVTATAGSGTAVYTGAQHSPSACVVSGTFTSGVTCVNSPASVGPGGGTSIITPVTSGAGSNFLVTPVNGSFTITPASTPVSINNLPNQPSFGSSFTPTYAYLGDGVTSVTSNTPATCIVSGATVQFVGVGTCTLTAHATGTASYQPATGTPQSVEICQASPTISISNIPVGAVIGGSFAPTYDYPGDGLKSVTSSTPGRCTVSGGAVNFLTAGTCTLRAKATGTVNSNPATGLLQSFLIGKLTATVSITNLPVGAVYGGSFTPTFVSTGNGTKSATSSTLATCKVVTGGLVKFVGAGTCTLTAHATSTSLYNAAHGSPQSFVIGQASPTVSISNLPAGATYGGSFKPGYTYNGDGLKSATSSTPLVCVISGTFVKFVGVGACTLTAQATATANVTAATGSAQSFLIAQATAPIKISNLPTAAKVGKFFTPNFAYAGDGLRWVTSSTPATCSVAGTVVTFLSVGTCTLTAHATATTNFAAATGLPQSFPIELTW